MSTSIHKPLPLSDVTCKTACFVSGYAPDLHMPLDDPHADSVVYLLRCAPQMLSAPFTSYVGRAKRSKLATRMKKHLAGTASDFTAENKPLFLEALYVSRTSAFSGGVCIFRYDGQALRARNYGWTPWRMDPNAPETKSVMYSFAARAEAYGFGHMHGMRLLRTFRWRHNMPETKGIPRIYSYRLCALQRYD